jgi:hypothetical protein
MKAAIATNCTSPFILAGIAELAAEGDADHVARLGQVIGVISSWDAPTCRAFVRLLDSKTASFLVFAHEPMVNSNPALAIELAALIAAGEEVTRFDIFRWERLLESAK